MEKKEKKKKKKKKHALIIKLVHTKSQGVSFALKVHQNRKQNRTKIETKKKNFSMHFQQILISACMSTQPKRSSLCDP